MKNAAAHIPQILSNVNAVAAAVPKVAAQSHLAVHTAPAQPPPLTVQTNVAGPAALPSSPVKCLIPGCDEEAYVDADGQQTGDYCSMSHRE